MDKQNKIDKSINTTRKLVQKILEEIPEARNNDNLLFLEVVKRIDKNLLKKPLDDVFRNFKKYNLPSTETVRRCRAKMQAERPELASDRTTQRYKKEKEKAFRKMARDKPLLYPVSEEGRYNE